MYRGGSRVRALLLRLDGVWVFGCGCIRSLISVVSPRTLFPGRREGREGVTLCRRWHRCRARSSSPRGHCGLLRGRGGAFERSFWERSSRLREAA